MIIDSIWMFQSICDQNLTVPGYRYVKNADTYTSNFTSFVLLLW